jgi:hypothetical protein
VRKIFINECTEATFLDHQKWKHMRNMYVIHQLIYGYDDTTAIKEEVDKIGGYRFVQGDEFKALKRVSRMSNL